MKTPMPHCVSELVSTFTPDKRKMLMLHWAEEMTPHEIEMVLDLPQDTVSATLADIKGRTERVLKKNQSDSRAA